MPSTIDNAHQLDVKHFHLFCGLGGGARGFNNGHARVGQLEAKFRCLGGIDSDPAAIPDFNKLAGVPGTVLDMFSLEQYVAFHGKAPPPGWQEATVADIHTAAGNERPDIVFLSAPCLPANGLVMTESGVRAISTVRARDRVLSHKGRMRPVTHVGTHEYTGTMFGFRLNGTVDVQEFTDEHPLSGDRVDPSTGDIRNPATLRSRTRQDDGSIGRFSARQGRAETDDEDAGRGVDDAAASRAGLGHAADCGGGRV